MALPTTIVSSAGVKGFQPPVKSSDGDFWTVVPTTATAIDAYKATDPTSSWTLTDGSNNPTFTALGVISLVQDGDDIHIVTYDSGDIEYHLFDASAETWSITNEVIETPSQAPSFPWVSIAVRSDGDVIVAYAGDTDGVMGGQKERVDYARREASSWTVGVAVDAAGDIHYGNPNIVKGATSDDMHIIFSETTDTANDPPTTWANVQMSTLDATNNLSTIVSVSDDTNGTLSAYSNAVSFDDSGTVRMGLFRADGGAFFGYVRSTEDGSGDASTPTVHEVIPSGAGNPLFIDTGVTGELAVYSIAEDAGVLYGLYSGGGTSGVDQDIFFTDSTNEGVSWSTPVEDLDAVTCDLIFSNIYLRGTDTVLAYVYDDGGVQKYNERLLIAGASDISPTGLASVEAFGSHSVTMDQTVTATGIVSAEVFGTATLGLFIEPTGIVSAEALGSPTLTVTADIAPTGITSAEVYGTLVVDVEAVEQDISPTGIVSAEAFGTAIFAGEIARNTQSVLEVLYQPPLPDARNTQAVVEVLYHELVALLPTGIASLEAFGSPTITTPLGASPAGIASAEAFGTTTLTTEFTVSPTSIASAEAFGTHLVSVEQFLLPTGITSGEAFGSHKLSISVSVAGIASLEAFGNPTITLDILPTGIASEEVFGSHTVGVGAVDISPTSISSAEAFGAHIVESDDKFINAPSIGSAEAFGTATITTQNTIVTVGITSAETFGSHSVVFALLPAGIVSEEAFGTHTVTTGVVDVAPASIASEEAFGATTVDSTFGITVLGIPTAEAFGNPVFTATADIAPNGISSAEAFGSHAVQLDVTISVAGIPSEEAFGTALVQIVGLLQVFTPSILSAEAFGTARIGLFLEPNGIPSEEFVEEYLIFSPPWLITQGVPSEEAFGTALIGQQLGDFSFILTEEAFGTPNVGMQHIMAGIPSAEVFGNTTVGTGEVTITPSGITSLEAFGVASTFAAFPLQGIECTGIVSEEAFGSTFAQHVQDIAPSSIASGETFNVPGVGFFNDGAAIAWQLSDRSTEWKLERRSVDFGIKERTTTWTLDKRQYE